MTQERYFRLIATPELLSGITYEELKTLSLAYPYAHNLHYLLALKARQINHPEANRTLSMAAAYSLDRKRLLHFLTPKVVAPVRAPEEVLELKPIEVVRRDLPAPEPVRQQAMMEDTPAKAPLPNHSAPTVPEEEPLDTSSLIASPPQQSDFEKWTDRFKPPTLLSEELPEREHTPYPLEKAETPKNYPVAQKLAEKSVSENKAVISETLARLLVKQGYREKAIAMYEQLCLAIPEKTAIFAAEIEKLKK